MAINSGYSAKTQESSRAALKEVIICGQCGYTVLKTNPIMLWE